MTYYVVNNPHSKTIHTNQDTALVEAKTLNDCSIRSFRSREDAIYFLNEKSSSFNDDQNPEQSLSLCDKNLLSVKLEPQTENVKYISHIIKPTGTEEILMGFTQNGMKSSFLAEILAIDEALRAFPEETFYIFTENARLIQIYQDHIKSPIDPNGTFPFVLDAFNNMSKRKVTISVENPCTMGKY